MCSSICCLISPYQNVRSVDRARATTSTAPVDLECLPQTSCTARRPRVPPADLVYRPQRPSKRRRYVCDRRMDGWMDSIQFCVEKVYCCVCAQNSAHFTTKSLHICALLLFDRYVSIGMLETVHRLCRYVEVHSDDVCTPREECVTGEL